MKEKKTMAFVFLGFLILLGFILTFSCTYTVDQSEYAVLETFGKPSSNIINPGLNFKLPYPIQSVRKISRETFSLTLGYEETKSNMVIHENESKMITGDENIILADLEVQWRISDPIAFLYNTDQPVNIL
ncbi:MAG: FtsH protease activity modulator HflK, partial [Epulopiscium sp.]|nr:FtsH protease activity modulator HflK [Candidatus Epulonipiscium sp.]